MSQICLHTPPLIPQAGLSVNAPQCPVYEPSLKRRHDESRCAIQRVEVHKPAGVNRSVNRQRGSPFEPAVTCQLAGSRARGTSHAVFNQAVIRWQGLTFKPDAPNLSVSRQQ